MAAAATAAAAAAATLALTRRRRFGSAVCSQRHRPCGNRFRSGRPRRAVGCMCLPARRTADCAPRARTCHRFRHGGRTRDQPLSVMCPARRRSVSCAALFPGGRRRLQGRAESRVLSHGIDAPPARTWLQLPPSLPVAAAAATAAAADASTSATTGVHGHRVDRGTKLTNVPVLYWSLRVRRTGATKAASRFSTPRSSLIIDRCYDLWCASRDSEEASIVQARFRPRSSPPSRNRLASRFVSVSATGRRNQCQAPAYGST
jgi:hypothetical protein